MGKFVEATACSLTCGQDGELRDGLLRCMPEELRALEQSDVSEQQRRVEIDNSLEAVQAYMRHAVRNA